MSVLLALQSTVITGVVGTANAAETSALSSAEVITGTAATNTPASSGALTGLEVVTGATTTANAAETAALSSAEVITGAVATATPAESSDLAGLERILGAVETGTAPETTTLSSAEVITGAASSAGAPGSSDVTGELRILGAVDSGTPAQTATLSSVEVVSGSADTAGAAQTADATALEVIAGALETATPPQTGDAAGASTDPEPQVPVPLPAIAALAPGQPGAWHDSTVPPSSTEWTDRVGGDDNLATVDGAPIVVPNVLNGRAVVAFDGTTRLVTSASPVGANPLALSLVALATFTDDAPGGDLFNIKDATDNGYVRLYSPQNDLLVAEVTSGAAYVESEYTHTDTPAAPFLFECYLDDHASIPRFYINGAERAAVDFGHDWTPCDWAALVVGGDTALDRMHIGGAFLLATLPVALSLDDRQTLYTWVTGVYGLALPTLVESTNGPVETGQDAQTTEATGTVTPPEPTTPPPVMVAPLVVSLRRRRALDNVEDGEDIAGAAETEQAPQSSTLVGTVTAPLPPAVVLELEQLSAPTIVAGTLETSAPAQGATLAGRVGIVGRVATGQGAQGATLAALAVVAGAGQTAQGAQRSRLRGTVTPPTLFGVAEWDADDEAAILAAATLLLEGV